MKSVKIIGLVLFMLAIMTNCAKDDDSTITRVYGTVTFENIDTWANWIDSGEVQITVFPRFSLDPMAGWGEVPDGFFGPNVPGGTFAVGAPYNSQNPIVLTYEPGKTVYNYDIEVDPGTYSALAVGFRHAYVQDATLSTATLGVYWNNETQVSHGVVLKVDVGNGMIIPVFNYPAPLEFTINDGEEREMNFMADFSFVNAWYR